MTHTLGANMELEALEEFQHLQAVARRIISSRGASIYEWWIDKKYKYPLEPWMDAYDPVYDRSPLTTKEEQDLVDTRDRRLGLSRQTRLDTFFKHTQPSQKRPLRELKGDPVNKQRKLDEFRVQK